jgi:nucleoside-diphosphate-sugar epimerase
MLGKKLKPIHDKPRPGDIRHSLANISKAINIIGYKPKYSLKEGLRETIKWFSKSSLKN